MVLRLSKNFRSIKGYLNQNENFMLVEEFINSPLATSHFIFYTHINYFSLIQLYP